MACVCVCVCVCVCACVRVCVCVCVSPPPALAAAPGMLCRQEGTEDPGLQSVSRRALSDVSGSWPRPVNICSPYSNPGIPFQNSHGLIWQHVPGWLWPGAGRASYPGACWLRALPPHSAHPAQAQPTEHSEVVNICTALHASPSTFTLWFLLTAP